MQSLRASITACSLGIIAVFTPCAVAGAAYELLHSFVPGTTEGSPPDAGLVQGSDGNFYGTTGGGGANGYGTVFKMTPAGALTTLVNFTDDGATNKGAEPRAGLVLGSDGNFYGTTQGGGASGFGTVFKMTPAGALTTLVEFTGNGATNAGSGPTAGLVQSIDDGNFYGTTSGGGANGDGTIFKMTPAGVLTTLVEFIYYGPTNEDASPVAGEGASPVAGLVQGSDGNFYGTTESGGGPPVYPNVDVGTIFKMTPAGVLTTLVEFTIDGATNKGANPRAGLVLGSDGNFYGTTTIGGANDFGTVFKMTPAGALTTLVEFTGNGATNAGRYPGAGLVQGSDGNFYGTTDMGGANDEGTVFSITPAGVLTTLVSFTGNGATDQGSSPQAGLVQGSNGNFYGTTTQGGADGAGTVFRIRLNATYADFNGDGHPDYLLFNPSTLQSAIWHLTGPAIVSQNYGPTLPAGWTVVGAGDFDGSGKMDYLLFNPNTRQTAFWYMNDTVHLGGAYGPTLPAGWSIVGVADFNGDGSPDYLLYDASTRQTAIWYLNGNVRIGNAYGPTLPAGWTVAGVADFNGDGHPDYLLFNASTRQTAIWYLNNNVFMSSSYGPTLPAGWTVSGTADFNGDGHPDYCLFDPGTRQTAIWYLNGATFVNGVYAPTVSVGWNLVVP